MTANEGVELLLEMEKTKNEGVFDKDSVFCVVSGAGSDRPYVYAGSSNQLIAKDFGSSLHTLVIPANLHFIEVEALECLANLSSDHAKRLG